MAPRGREASRVRNGVPADVKTRVEVAVSLLGFQPEEPGRSHDKRSWTCASGSRSLAVGARRQARTCLLLNLRHDLRDSREVPQQGIQAARTDGVHQLLTKRRAGCPQLGLLSTPCGGERYAPRTTVSRVWFAHDEPLSFESNQHGSHGVGIGRRSAHQLLLSESAFLRQQSEKHILVGGDSLLQQRGVSLSVHGPIRTAQGHGEYVTFRIHS